MLIFRENVKSLTPLFLDFWLHIKNEFYKNLVYTFILLFLLNFFKRLEKTIENT